MEQTMRHVYPNRPRRRPRSRFLLAFVLAAGSAAAENLLTNGTLDAWSDGRPAGWTVDTAGQAVRPEPGGGLRLDVGPASGNTYGEIRQTVPVRPGARYVLRGEVKGGADGLCLLQAKPCKNGTECDRISTRPNHGADWQPVETSFAIGEADSVQVLLRWRREAEHVGQTAAFRKVVLELAAALVYRGPESGPTGVPTFNSLGLYWRPAGGAPERTCAVRYRKAGAAEWKEALPLWFDPNEHADEGAPHAFEYRGSIVHLDPATDYEIGLSLGAGGPERTLRARTWDERFAIARTVAVPAADPGAPLVIERGGSEAEGYVLYAPTTPHPAVRDGRGTQRANVEVRASWIIVRGLTLCNAARHGIELGDVDHVVIEDCDISGWGAIEPPEGFGVDLDSAIHSASRALRHVVVQHCDLHHPRSDSNSWLQPHGKEDSHHPRGPQGISFRGGQGEYVIRFNRIRSDLQHMFNDGMGEVHNFSFDGFPNRDSDIHDNFVSHCWDDGLEIEGADMNVRVWNNYIDTTFDAIGAASPSLGPVYFWRNVYAVSRQGEGDSARDLRGHCMFKLGHENPAWVRGRMYVFHNTALQAPSLGPHGGPSGGAQAGIVFTSDRKRAENIVTRNNVFQLRTPSDAAIRDPPHTANNDYDYDLYTGRIEARPGSEAHGIAAAPVYERSPDGRCWLRPGTPGFDAGVRLPNFNDDFTGAAPDMGAVETGSRAPKPPLWPAFPAAAAAE